MKIARYTMLIFLLCGVSAPVLGCKPLMLEPKQKFEMSSAVVLAHPIAIATSPESALNFGFQEEFTQTIQWQVLISWKGSYRPGEVITTMTEHQLSNCGTGAQYTREPMLLFLEGKEPFTTPLVDRPVDSIGDLKFLDQFRRGG